MVIASVPFFPPANGALLGAKLSFTLAAVVTYNTILTGLLSALMVVLS